MDEVESLRALRVRLAERGVPADLRGEALVVRPPASHLPVWVFVGYGGAFFCWQSAEERHPVTDVAGAADALALYTAPPTSLFDKTARS
ncbi:hypothetical protein GCM10010156_20180 [Planobispora rosea]|uniref:Uncharacterized protein n=1 Tax=Planobispora rosea TaxID=35762 RepID=A0A8J3WF54_PLARO|nr:hypothetical protein [Planobispora rosea]GGS61519.1 hypothetical protein GCM10010156_20180 [Planobispora rosea]GIH86522.1 hypothetical protein Pro02_49300 [Planobispora rosea]